MDTHRHLVFRITIIILCVDCIVSTSIINWVSLSDECLRVLGYQDKKVQELTQYQLGELINTMDEKYKRKDETLRELYVLTFMWEHMEFVALHLDPVKNTPLQFIHDFYIYYDLAYVKWYRIITNSQDRRIKKFITVLQTKAGIKNETILKMEAAKHLATISYIICNRIYLGWHRARADIGLLWYNGKEVAEAFTTLTDEGIYENVIQVFFDQTKFNPARYSMSNL